MAESSKGKKTSNSIEEMTDAIATFTAYDEVTMRGQEVNVVLRKESMGLFARAAFAMNQMAFGKSASFFIKRVALLWCPAVEPGNLSTISLEASYYLGEEVDDMNATETVINCRGRISEGLKLIVFPTRPILKKSNEALFIPWRFSATLDENVGIEKDATLGVLKVWCHFDMKMGKKFGKLKSRQYINPKVIWTNDHHPYYIPFFLMKAVRGINPMLWRDTSQYVNFKRDVVQHVDPRVITPKNHLPLMQILSKEDVNRIYKITQDCHVRLGGTCTCGDNLDKFMSSVLLNNNDKCNNHGDAYDEISQQVYTGHIKSVNAPLNITF